MNFVQRFTGSRTRVLTAAAIALTIFLMPAAVANAQGNPKNLHMVSVGINNAIGQPVLKAVAKDARDMAKWANSQQGKLFGQVHISTLTDNNATKSNVLNHLSGLQNKAKSGEYVIFYVSCHGGQSENGEFFFCGYDQNVYWGQIKNALRNVPGTKIVIIDTCHAGAAHPKGDNLIVFAACLANQLSHDGSGAGGNSVYTQYLLEGLYGKADFNKNGLVSLSEAAGYASSKLNQNFNKSAGANDKQNSTWYKPKNVSAELPLAKVGSGAGNGNGGHATSTGGSGQVNAGNAAGTWTGSENLGGYGKLTFVLQPGGKATMYDAKDTVPGTWSQNGNQVTIQVGATYHGTINGNVLSGQGNGKSAPWTFSVSKTK